MKKIAVFTILLASFIADGAIGATAQRRGRTVPNTTNTATSQSTGTAGRTTSARAAVARTAPTAKVGSAERTTSARAAVNKPTAAPAKTVSARAGTTQKVINSGTKVAVATKNTVVNEECQAKFEGCMDAFCMIDNENGGRCMCSDRGAELDEVLAEIEKLDEQSYQMATLGVEKLEMGADADAAIAAANQVADSLKNPETTKKGRQALNLNMWNTIEEDDDLMLDIFATDKSDVNMSSIDGKTGNALQRAASNLCVAQIPECANDAEMLKLMYAQKIKSDCGAYENSLKQKKNQSAQKLQAAERALRETALEQYQNANKYDLGQCTIKFRECMQSTADCGNDFSKCASVVAIDTTNVRHNSNKPKGFKIMGAMTAIEISASTYDTLVAKKPLCETVTKQCTKVADQVWDTFLKEIAPQLKSAELIAEDNARQNCIGSISDCFQKACKDNMDPSDPDGSYDMCLSRPETMLNVCKVPLNACGIDASSAQAAQKSQIWEFVTARLAAMRVDECTTQVKKCLTDENRCGEDYTQCIGMDTDTIINMCPKDKLTACFKKEYGATDFDQGEYIFKIAEGLMLNIDNAFLAECQKAVNEAMLKVCGSTDNCDAMTITDDVGTHALEYKICQYNELGDINVNSVDATDAFDGMYLFHECKQDVSLIPDDDLLGTVTYKTETMPENYLSFDTINSIKTDIADLIKKKAEILNDANGSNAASNSINASRIQSSINQLISLKNTMKGEIAQQDVTFKFKEYNDVKQYMGMIDGVIKWSDLNIKFGKDCSTDITIDRPLGSTGDSVTNMCLAGFNVATQPEHLGQNSTVKQNQIESDLGSLANSISNTIRAIESDPTVQFCMTGRKVQGIQRKNRDGTVIDPTKEEKAARFPDLTNSMRMLIVQSALKKAQNNYNKRYNELSEKLAKDNVTLAERMVKVRKEREKADRAELSARACLSLGANSALPVTTKTDLAQLQSGQGYTASSKNDDPYHRETVTTTFSPETLICKRCTRTQTCKKRGGYKDCCLIDSRYCKEWGEVEEKCTDTQF